MNNNEFDLDDYHFLLKKNKKNMERQICIK